MDMRIAAGLGVALLGAIAVGGLAFQRGVSAAEAEAEAWERLAPRYTVHYCRAPTSEVYRSREISYVHVTPRGLGMATLEPSGETTLLDALGPIGTLTWSPEGCSVGPVKSRLLTVQVLDATGTPVPDARVASCYWLDMARTDAAGRAVLSVPPRVRCKLAASTVDGEFFTASESVALEDDVSEVTLTLAETPRAIADQKRDLALTLDALGNRASKTSYDRAIEAASPAAATILGTWRDQYRARQRAALASMRAFLEDGEEGWLRLSR